MIWVFFTSLVFADAIPIPADQSCPPGARLSASHHGVWCIDTTCETNHDCYENETCQMVSLCVNNDQALDICEENSCENGECVTQKRCVTEDGTTNVHPQPGCGGCSTTKPTGIIGLSLLSIAAIRRQTDAFTQKRPAP